MQRSSWLGEDLVEEKRSNDPIWEQALKLIADQVNEGTFRIWFEPTIGLGLVDGTYSVGVASDFARDWIDSRFRVLMSDAITEIKQLLGQLDKPAKSLTLEFFVIRANVRDRDEYDAAPLPSKLKQVAKTLEENGFGNPSLIAPIIVVTDEGQHFESESALRSVYDEGALEETLLLEVSGEARLQPGGNLVHMTVEAEIRGNYLDVSQGITDGEAHFDAATTIAAKLGSYVIIAAAPGTTARGDTIGLVVRATADNE